MPNIGTFKLVKFFNNLKTFGSDALGSPGPLDKNIPSGFFEIIYSNVVV